MTPRLSSGSAPLDTVLGGGVPRDAITLLIGPPGAGKTIFAQQYVFANAQPERPALYLSTVSEPLEKILRYGQRLSFFDPTAIGTSVVYDTLGDVLSTEGLPGVVKRLRELIRQHRPAVMIIDSFKAMHPYAVDSGEFRRFLHELASMLSAFPVTALWIGEYEDEETIAGPESAVADAIVTLSFNAVAERVTRKLSVRKLRGGSFLGGRHSYRLSADGITVYPRMADPTAEQTYQVSQERMSSGVQAIDDMLSDGYWPGASTLIAGPTGIGKTLMGLHFVFNGAHQGQPGVIATLQENPTQLERIVQSFGWSLEDDDVSLLYRTLVDLSLDEWVYELLDMIERTGAKRVLIDSLNDLQSVTSDNTRFREFVYSLLQRCSQRGVSLMFTYEVPELFGITRLAGHGVSHLADNVLLLQYRKIDSNMARTLTVLKTRASRHDPSIREFEITGDGITLASRAD